MKKALPIAKAVGKFVPGMGQAIHGLELAQSAGQAVRRITRKGGLRNLRGRDARALGAVAFGMPELGALDDGAASRALRITRWDVARARAFAGDAGALEGTVYVVEPGDYGVRIAQKLVGDGNRWRELKAVNPTIATRPDPKNYGLVIYAGDRLTLPASWIAQLGLSEAPPVVLGSAPGGAISVSPAAPSEALPPPVDPVVLSTPPDFSLPPVSPTTLTPPVFTPPVFTPPVFTPPVFTPPVFTPSEEEPEPVEPAVVAQSEPAATQAQAGGAVLPIALAAAGWALGLF